MYDAGGWFLGVSGQHLRGHDVDTGAPLATIPPDQVATTVGARFFDRKFTVAMRWAAVAAKKAEDIPLTQTGELVYAATGAYNLVKLYLGYQPSPDVLAAFSIDNLLNEQYTPYMNQLASPGITVKGEVKIRFGEHFYKKG
jgi:hemoglobin/transferrin/lactoferrin receptor protein